MLRLVTCIPLCRPAPLLQAISAEEIFESPEGQTFYRHVTLLVSLLPHHCTHALAALPWSLGNGSCTFGSAGLSYPAVPHVNQC